VDSFTIARNAIIIYLSDEFSDSKSGDIKTITDYELKKAIQIMRDKLNGKQSVI
jgi:hypothetical protein